MRLESNVSTVADNGINHAN